MINPLDIAHCVNNYYAEPLFSDDDLAKDPILNPAKQTVMRDDIKNMDVLMNIKAFSTERTKGNKLFTRYLKNLKNDPDFMRDWRTLSQNGKAKKELFAEVIDFFIEKKGSRFLWKNKDDSFTKLSARKVVRYTIENFRRLK